jgi:hypothetical protein
MRVEKNQVYRETIAAEQCELVICRRADYCQFQLLERIERQNSVIL